MPLDISITNEEQVRVAAAPVTASGRAARLDGPLTVTVDSGTGTAGPGSVDNEVLLISGDTGGDTVYTISGDADLGAGVVTISDTVTLHVNEAQASGLGLSSSAVEPKP